MKLSAIDHWGRLYLLVVVYIALKCNDVTVTSSNSIFEVVFSVLSNKIFTMERQFTNLNDLIKL